MYNVVCIYINLIRKRHAQTLHGVYVHMYNGVPYVCITPPYYVNVKRLRDVQLT